MMLMFDVAGTWRAALPLRVQVETTLESILQRPCKRDIPRELNRVFDSRSVTLSFSVLILSLPPVQIYLGRGSG